AVLPGMIARGQGHLVGVASMAGYRGFPWMISYSASKAALIAYLEAMRPGLRRRGVTVTTVCPGFVRTRMCTSIPYQRPVKMIEPEEAARHLVRAIERRPRNCVFPWSMRIGLAVLKHMPDSFFDRLMSWWGPQALNVEF
ncbi:MAG TPA: SDR family NAD(P)-dependent oxidoreductase, partial [Isosphaeraceae bacterium]|nr:SDR family NAD(P)-dependent oxidoreductase [Isosphaeraceae bacterium]